MKNEEFLKIMHNRMEKIERIQKAKGEEYSRNGDRLSNFKRAAAMLQCTPARALLGALSKHLTSLLDMIDDVERGELNALPVWEEKITDSMVYHILLEAVIREAIFNATTKNHTR